MRWFSRVPDWLIGLALAAVIVFVLFFVLGIGDDPTLVGG